MTKNSIYLLCTDFDGTLYSESHSPRIPEKLIEMIQELRKQGMLWMVNTGRDLEYLLESLVEDLHDNDCASARRERVLISL